MQGSEKNHEHSLHFEHDLDQLITEKQRLVPNNSENLRLSDFINLPFPSVAERADAFSKVIANYTGGRQAIWMRENSLGAAAHSRMPSYGVGGPMLDEVMLGSNNYLGFAMDPYILACVKKSIDHYGLGSGGPPLLNGMLSIHRELETRLANLKEAEDCLLFASGYQANLGWVEALPQSGDLLLYDEQSHASLFDGIAMTKSSRRYRAFRFKHNCLDHLAKLLAEGSIKFNRQIFVAVEGVYSMCGDLAPLPEIQQLCREYNAFLVVDDAHGTGVLGRTGKGTAEHFGLKVPPDLTMGTFSKAFGAVGGFICGTKAIVDYLRFFARSYMFSAHLPPPIVAGVLGGLDLLEDQPERLENLRRNVAYLVRGLRHLGLNAATQSAIITIRVPETIPIRPLTLDFHEGGVFLNCIEYPAVARGDQCLRISVMATHCKADLDHVLKVFYTLGYKWKFIDSLSLGYSEQHFGDTL